MAAVRNPTQFGLYSHALGRSLDAGEVVDGISEELARSATESGVFELGVLAPAPEPDEPDTTDEDDEPKRPRGRPRSVRGSVEVEEAVSGPQETR